MTSADINGDGKPDLIVANRGESTVSVLLNGTGMNATIPGFPSTDTFVVGSHPSAVAAGDVNGDGKPDLVVANSSDGTISVLLNTTATGAMTPGFSTQQTFATGVGPSAVTTADINGDGKPDLIVANNGLSVSVFLNTTSTGAAAASFAPPQTFSVGLSPDSVAVADFNNDTKPDLAVANFNDGTVSVLLNTTAIGAGTATFAAKQTVNVGGKPASVDTADIDGDGRPDLIVADYQFGEVTVLLDSTASGAATASFGAPWAFVTGAQSSSVAAADVNGDGKPDLVVANYGDNTLAVLLNATVLGDSKPYFGTMLPLTAGSGSQSVTVADINGDGAMDLIVADYSGNSVSTLLNNATPSFAPQQTFATGAAPDAIASDDINGDGRPDLVVANSTGANVSVLLNSTAPGAGFASFGVQQAFATGANPDSVVTGDVNSDGKPDLIVANANANTISVLLNTTSAGSAIASFAAQQTFATGAYPDAVIKADVNNDGIPDVVVLNQNSNTISVLLNTTAPGALTAAFTAQQTFAVGSTPFALAIADLNGDTKPDLVVANFGGSNVSVLLNTTPPDSLTASFAAQQFFAVGPFPTGVTTADMDGDGKPDIVAATPTGSSVAVLLNSTMTNAATASFVAARSIIAASAPAQISAADINGDGKPDIIATYSSGGGTVCVLLDTTLNHIPTLATQRAFATGMIPSALAVADVDGDGEADLIVANRGGNSVSVLLNTQKRTIFTGSPATGTIVHDYIFGNGFE